MIEPPQRQERIAEQKATYRVTSWLFDCDWRSRVDVEMVEADDLRDEVSRLRRGVCAVAMVEA